MFSEQADCTQVVVSPPEVERRGRPSESRKLHTEQVSLPTYFLILNRMCTTLSRQDHNVCNVN